MMNYDTFATAVVARIKDILPQSFAMHEVERRTVYKPNKELDAMTLKPPAGVDAICPVIYLNDAYEVFMHTNDLDRILNDMANLIKDNTMAIPEGNTPGLPIEEDRIIMQVINTKRNAKYLETVPHREIMDLSVIYRVIMNMNDEGMDSFVITDSLLKDMDMTERDLYETAVVNMRTIDPFYMFDLMNIDQAISDGRFNSEKDIEELFEGYSGFTPLCLTNTSKVNGASYLADNELLDMISSYLDDNFYLFPVSIHEVFIFPEHSVENPEFLKCLLQDGNVSIINPEDYLSDSIYYFDKNQKELSIKISSEITLMRMPQAVQEEVLSYGTTQAANSTRETYEKYFEYKNNMNGRDKQGRQR